MPYRVAVVQDRPKIFDLPGTLDRVRDLTAKAADEHRCRGNGLVLFPEAFIPAYPRGFDFGCVVGSRAENGRELFRLLSENAVEIPSPATERLGEIAREFAVHLAIGVVEREPLGGTLYCTLLAFDPDGDLVCRHRKLKPTGSERLIWGEGDGSTLDTFPTPAGVAGGLICWENYMPLVRAAMYGKGVGLYLAPTADHRPTWTATMQHIACEGRCYVLGCNQYHTIDDYPQAARDLQPDLDPERAISKGGSVIVSPRGEILAGPLFDEQGILSAEIDPEELTRVRLDFDAVGHYARPDVARLVLNEDGDFTPTFDESDASDDADDVL
ncbi:MAG: carbon-nitrogen hydrolase family protein [Planctomycetota bacterium]